MKKRLLTAVITLALLVNVFSLQPVFAAQVKPAEDVKVAVYGAENYKIQDWSQKEKDEFIRLINNLHRNVNLERPDLKLCENVIWRDDLTYVSKVKLDYQYNANLSRGSENYSPHCYKDRKSVGGKSAYETLKPLMNGYFLKADGYVINREDPPYFYLENECIFRSSYPLKKEDISVEDLLIEYLTEENNPNQNVGHATALLGASGIGSAIDVYQIKGKDPYKYGIHEITTYEGTDLKRSVNNDMALYQYAKTFYKNRNKVKELLKDPVGKWILDGYGWKYITEDGKVLNEGLNQVGEYTYLIDKDGYMLTQWQEYNGQKYYFHRTGGNAVKNWQKIDNIWYTFSPNTYVLRTGWYEEKGFKYFLEEDGKMATGFKDIDGKTYFFHKTGGNIVKGWQRIGKNSYFFDKDGVLAKNTVVDGIYKVDENGVWIK